MRLSSIWTCSGAPHLCRRHGLRQTRAQTPSRVHLRTHVRPSGAPYPVSAPPWEIRRLETGQPWPMYIFMGLIWHHFSPLPEKEMYLIYTIPIWPVHQGERHIGKVGLKSGFHPFSRIYFAGVCVGKFVPVHVQQDCVFAKEKIEISHDIPELYSRLSGSCASQFEWEDGSCTQQMLCVY